MTKKRSTSDSSQIIRRELIKGGLLAGSAYIITTKKSLAYGEYSYGGYTYSDRDYRDDRTVQSPPTRPFIEDLPIPPVAQPVMQLNPAPAANFVAGEAPRDDHQLWNDFLPQKLYEARQREGLHSFHRDLPTQTIWGFNGITPGPTYYARYGEPILVRMYNNLPANHIGFGIPSVITHLHNGHTPSESDGFPADFYEVGVFKDHHYPNVLAGFSTPQFAATRGDPREALSTLWYHDHRVDFTAPNVYRGLAGFYFLFDDRDSGNENDPSDTALRLPSGAYDVPLMLNDKVFDAQGRLYFDQFNLDGILGDKFLVNSKIQPTFKVERRKYRFRILNGGPSRFYELFLSNGQPFVRISSDGNLLPRPLTVQSVRLSVAERHDVIVDFSTVPIGTSIFLENRLEQRNGQGPESGLLSRADATPLLRFDVVRDPATPDRSQIPATLRELPTIVPVVRTRTWDFDQRNGQWVVNGRLFDFNRVDAMVKRNTAEQWVLRNGWRRWSHPIHIHFEEHQIQSRNGTAPGANSVERARKDVVELRPGDEIKLFMQFRDFTGRYVMHCHNTIHEDHAMMVRWDIVP